MAKVKPSNTKEVYKFPSRFGSHSSMVDAPLTEALNDPNLVVIRDEHKEPYTTERNRLDNGMADPNRYTEVRLAYLLPQKADK